MPKFRLELPTLQNWSCHGCTDCCRHHVIEVSEEERQRILAMDWSGDDGFPVDSSLLVWHSGPPWRKNYRLAHQPNGACVFLDEKGLCRIHAKSGEAAKPLPCRIYPFAFHPVGNRLAVSVRCSCPSAAANRGEPLKRLNGELQNLAGAVLPEGFVKSPPPSVTARQSVDWADFQQLIAALDTSLAEPKIPLAVRFLRSLNWLAIVKDSQFESVRGQRLTEFLDLIRQSAAHDVPEELSLSERPSRIGFTQLRLLVGQYARTDTVTSVQKGISARWRLLLAGLRFTLGRGKTPAIQQSLPAIPFTQIEKSFGAVPAEVDEILTRFFRVKVQTLHFCGPAYYGVSLVEGFQSLTLMFPALMWLSRWIAAGEGRNSLSREDVRKAISLADHHHGYSPVFGSRPFRRRVRLLVQSGDLQKVVAWYAR